MDFLNKGLAQLGDLFRSMTPAARITSALLLAVIVISLAYLFNSQVSGPDGFLLGGQAFSANELPAMEAAFGKANLHDFVVEGNRIRIPRAKQATYMAALADSGALPANFGDHLAAAVKDTGVFMSRAQQEEALKAAKQRELALIIRSMPGIENAAVHYDLQKKSGFGQQSRLATASVSVKAQGSMPFDEKKVPMIRHLVAGAIAGLSPENVTVVDLNGRSYGGGSGGLGLVLEDPYLTRLKEYEAEFRSKVLDSLSYVPGIVVAVNVELDREVNRTRDEHHVDPKAVAVSVNETNFTKNVEGGNNGGPPGFQTQQPNRAAALSGQSGKGPSTQEDQSSTVTANAVSTDRTQTVQIGLTPKLVKYAIAVPSDYFLSIWRQRNPAPAGQPPQTPDRDVLEKIEIEETANIRKHVSMLVSNVDATVDAATRVTVTTFPRLPPETLPEPAIAGEALAWLSNSWSTLGMIGLAGVSLVMLRSMVKAAPQAPAGSTAAEMTAALAETKEEEEAGREGTDEAKSRRKRRLGSGPSLRDELVEMVREDPDAAANILRGWIGNAS